MKLRTMLFTWLLLFLSSGASLALTVDCPDFPEKVRQAQMIFDGTVAQLAVRQADLPNGRGARAGNPHTFYTFAINRIFKGSVAGGGDVVTLRFEGGDIRDTKGVAIVGESIPGVPTFKMGDRAILFVKNNGNTMSPLVCWGTHYKIWRTNDLPKDSQEAWITQDKKIIFKPSEERIQHLAKMIKETYAMYEGHFDALIRDLMGAQGPDAEYMSAEGLWVAPADAKPYDPDIYADILAERIEQVLEQQALTEKIVSPPVENQDINQPFYVDSGGHALDEHGKPLYPQDQ